jgi:hypothetical protein
MKRSRRHHYVSQFMIKHFAGANGKIFVFNKLENKFHETNPINLFLEKDRNTFANSDGSQCDVIERVYGELDSCFAKVLTEISSAGIVSGENYKLLLFLAYVSKWRVPQYDESFVKAKRFFSVGELGLGLKGPDEQQIAVDLEKYFSLDMHQELKRILLAVQPFRFKNDFRKLLRHSFLISTPYPSFISDCPFLEATLESDEVFEDFVFPVTRDLTLVYSTRIDRDEIQDFLLNGEPENVKAFQKAFCSGLNISLLDLAERNIACSDRDYLQVIVNEYQRFKAKGSNTAVYLTIFNVLYRFKEYIDS